MTAEPPLRSYISQDRSYVRFFNKTRRKIKILWIDFNGTPILYKTLEHDQFVDINTYVTHPWVFEDALTKERYLAKKRDFYMPPPARLRDWRQPGGQPTVVRDLVAIYRPMCSLRKLCIQIIKDRLKHDKEAFMLDLPIMLQHEIAEALPRKD